jgi:putative MFS transporter
MASRPTSGLAAYAPSASVVEDGVSTRAVTAAERLTARLDRLPMTRSLWIMAILLTFGGFFDGYAIGLIGALGPGLFKAKIFTPTTVSFFGLTGFASFVAALFAGLFVASLFVSYIADRFGRRAVFTYSLIWFGVANLIMGMQTTADGVNLWRFISALGVGLELVTVDAYLSELVPKRVRGTAFAFLQAMSAIAFLVSYFLSWQLIPNSPFGYDGWRWVAWIGSIAAVVVWWIRLGLPESPRWLAQQGRMEEAEHVMSGIEARVIADYGRPLPEPEQPHFQDPRKGSLMEIFSPRYLRRTIMLMLFNFFQTVGFYGFVAWTPTLLIAKGIHITESLKYSTIINIAAVAFPMLIMLFADKLERKWHSAASCLAIAVFGILFANAESTSTLIILGACLAMSTQWLSFGLHNYQAELYPTRIRARGVGFVYSWSRLSGILTPFLVAFFLRDFGATGVFVFVAACMGVVILSVGLLGPRTKMLEVEAIAH